jgi:5'-3' exonuclease
VILRGLPEVIGVIDARSVYLRGRRCAADGYPGIKGLGAKSASSLINRLGANEDFPTEALSEANRELALLFKTLATLRVDAPLSKVRNAETLCWKGATPAFASMAEKMAAARLLKRVRALEARL